MAARVPHGKTRALENSWVCCWGLFGEAGPPSLAVGSNGGMCCESTSCPHEDQGVLRRQRWDHLDKTNDKQCIKAVQSHTVSFSCHFCHHTGHRAPCKTGTRHLNPVLCHGHFLHLLSSRYASGPLCEPCLWPLFHPCLPYWVWSLAMTLAYPVIFPITHFCCFALGHFKYREPPNLGWPGWRCPAHQETPSAGHTHGLVVLSVTSLVKSLAGSGWSNLSFFCLFFTLS